MFFILSFHVTSHPYRTNLDGKRRLLSAPCQFIFLLSLSPDTAFISACSATHILPFWASVVRFNSFVDHSDLLSPHFPFLFQAYGSGCDVVILASDFECVQIIPGAQNGNIQVGCVECSHQLGRVSVGCTLRHTPTCSFHFYVKPRHYQFHRA